ncbi:hypothetical protein ACRYCC_03045 [Actinomadura scrupuli]|uniref:hypothetical protein n=1 Tax=Actinomadura scrupuli TaxID=559629 RepID=UPI003D977186
MLAGADAEDTVFATTVQLIRYLRELTRARRETVRDVAAYEAVHWLSELPGEVYVETDAAAGDVLFSVPVIPITPPAALEEFDGWLGLRRWYRTLRTLAGQVGHEYELVLATGLLTWQSTDGVRVRNHLLTTPVEIVVDPQTERADVLLVDRPVVITDRELLEGLAGFRPARTDWVRDAVRSGRGYGLQNSAADVLRKWCALAFEDGTVGFREDWADDQTAGGASRVRLAPALVLRKRDHTTTMDYYDAMLTELIGHGAEVPTGFARFVTGPPQRNLAQVADRSPRAVSELLVALLARGHRVLVTGSAAADLTAELPAEIAPLVATPATARQSLAMLADRFTAHDPERHRQVLTEQESRLATVKGIERDLRERLESLHEEETYDLAPGYKGTLTELTRRVADLADRFAWLPADEPIPPSPPLTADEAAELLGLLADRTPERAARTGQLLPDPAALPDAERVQTLIETERTALERAGRSASDLSARLVECDPAMLSRLDACATAVQSALGELGLPADPQQWDPADWPVRALRDGLSRRPSAWEHVSDLAMQAGAADRALRRVGDHRLALPPVEPSTVLPTLRELRDYLAAGGGLRRGPLRPSVQKNAEPLLNGASVDGAAPVTAELLDIVIAGLECMAACQALSHGWQLAGVTFPTGLPLAHSVALFSQAYRRLGQVRTALAAVGETSAVLFGAGLQVPLSNPAEWRAYTAALGGARLRLAAVRATAAVTALQDALELEVRKGPPPPELTEAVSAITARDAAAYRRSVAALAEAPEERLAQARCEELLARVRAVHPQLASLLAEHPDDPVWTGRLETWEQAWSWAYASVSLRNRPQSDLERQLGESLQETADRQASIFAEYTAGQAWGWSLSRMTASPGSVSLDTLPALVVPLWQVPETVPRRADSFDVVIVDEGAAEPVEALFLLWLAGRVIIMGPGPAAATELSVNGAGEPSVANLPDGLREAVGPSATLYDALQARLGPAVGSSGPSPVTVLETAPSPEPAADPARGDLPVRPGRSIVEYKRDELVQLIQHLAESGQSLGDEQLIMYARTVLDCPEDEDLLTTARLRYALKAFRAGES